MNFIYRTYSYDIPMHRTNQHQNGNFMRKINVILCL